MRRGAKQKAIMYHFYWTPEQRKHHEIAKEKTIQQTPAMVRAQWRGWPAGQLDPPHHSMVLGVGDRIQLSSFQL